ncbi:MAG: RDD family protein [Candidatus Bathyarchaeia archaeon]
MGIGPRLGAQRIDGVVLIIVYCLIGFALTCKTSWEISGEPSIPLIALGLIFLLYFSLFEGMAGATLGEMVLKIAVVIEDGSFCGLGAAFVRNILRIIYAMPFLYIIGMALISRSPKKQRLGDRVAHKVVVGSRVA